MRRRDRGKRGSGGVRRYASVEAGGGLFGRQQGGKRGRDEVSHPSSGFLSPKTPYDSTRAKVSALIGQEVSHRATPMRGLRCAERRRRHPPLSPWSAVAVPL